MNWMHFVPVSLGTPKRHLARLGERSTSLARASVREREKYYVLVGAAVASRAQRGVDEMNQTSCNSAPIHPEFIAISFIGGTL